VEIAGLYEHYAIQAMKWLTNQSGLISNNAISGYENQGNPNDVTVLMGKTPPFVMPKQECQYCKEKDWMMKLTAS
jgi:hypothetical protein